MTEHTDDMAVEPGGIGVSITKGGYVILEFDHGEIPPIRVTNKGAKQIGSHVNNAADRARDGGNFDD